MEQLTLTGLIKSRGPGELHDAEFMPAEEKRRVLKQWEAFLKSGCAREKFSQALYHHLIQHCSFIAHYDLGGFYAIYFERGDDMRHFLSQFDTRKGLPESIEYGMTDWIAGGNDVCQQYYDINIEMCRIAARYIPALELKTKNDQRQADLAIAEKLLKKHGIKVPEEMLK